MLSNTLKKSMAVTAMTTALVTVVLVTPGLAAGKGGGKGTTSNATASITINQADPRLGDVVDFTTVVPNGVSTPMVELICYQDSVRTFAVLGSVTEAYLLGGGSSGWLSAGGPALCTANLIEWTNVRTNHMTYTQYATTVFAAGDRLG